MSILWIVIVVILVLALLGYFGRSLLSETTAQPGVSPGREPSIPKEDRPSVAAGLDEITAAGGKTMERSGEDRGERDALGRRGTWFAQQLGEGWTEVEPGIYRFDASANERAEVRTSVSTERDYSKRSIRQSASRIRRWGGGRR